MKVKNKRCRIARFLEDKRLNNYYDTRDDTYKYEYVPSIRKCPHLILSMYHRQIKI